MKIAITLDDVIRNKSKQIIKIYKKYVDPDFDEDNVDLTTNDFQKILEYDTLQDYYKFLYEDYAFEIFAEGEVVEKMLDKKLNLWHIAINDYDEYDEPIEIMIANPFEFNASIGYTHFFLSKIATRIRETFFPTDSLEIWNKCDVLITADPKLLKNKPEGKKSVKIETEYNKDVESDFTYDKLSTLLADQKFIDKLFMNEAELIDEVNNNNENDSETND